MAKLRARILLMDENIALAVDIGRQCLLVTVKLAMPVLAAGLIVGVMISILQAATQIQEQTLTFVPKIAAMAASASFFGPWIAKRLLEYAETLLGQPPF